MLLSKRPHARAVITDICYCDKDTNDAIANNDNIDTLAEAVRFGINPLIVADCCDTTGAVPSIKH